MRALPFSAAVRRCQAPSHRVRAGRQFRALWRYPRAGRPTSGLCGVIRVPRAAAATA